MTKQKGIAPILIVILIAIALGGFLIYQKQTKPILLPQQTPQPAANPIDVHIPSGETTGWQIYTNKDYGYVINYPSDWILISESEDAHYIQIYGTKATKFSQVSPNNPPGSYFAISVIKAPANLALEEWLKQNNTTDQQSAIISIDNIRAFKYSQSDIVGDIGKDSFLVWVKKGEKIYKIVSVSFEGYTAPSENVYSQILSTFKFQ